MKKLIGLVFIAAAIVIPFAANSAFDHIGKNALISSAICLAIGLILLKLKSRKTGAEIFNPISARLEKALRERKDNQPKDEPHVFPDDIKRIRANGDPERITHEMKRLFERTGIQTTQTDKDGRSHTVASFHSLRHTFVSRLMERGVNPYYVQRAVGHSTMMMTAHYDHSATEEIRKALD